jgi:hypothetical protein
MATTKARSQLPFYFSSSGSNDEAKIEHDGVNFLIDNDTGLTKIGNKTNYNIWINHGSKEVGINTTPTAGYTFHVANSGSNPALVAERNTGEVAYFNATVAAMNVGSATPQDVIIRVNLLEKMRINTSGEVLFGDVYGDTVGATNFALYIDDTGKIGAAPSSVGYKEDIEPITDTSKLDLVAPVKYTIGGNMEFGFIAEDIAEVIPEAVIYRVYEIKDGKEERIQLSNYDNPQAEFNTLVPGVEKTIILKKKKQKNLDDDGTIDIQINVKKVPEGVKKDILIPLAIQRLKDQEIKIQNLVSRISALEVSAGIAPSVSILKKAFGKKK